MKILIDTAIHRPRNEQHEGFVRRLLRTLTLWRAVRRERRELSGLSDRELADIGINRMDALQECALPFWKIRASDPLSSPPEAHQRVSKVEDIERSAPPVERTLTTFLPAEQLRPGCLNS